ncbi:apolipoprotein D-like [Tachypleus tridentatus]|uniref:apolipoprotein D-like n=1 Tax=Tachypleus tridentatus TaxID=6853 RepID=UPI003FD14FD1
MKTNKKIKMLIVNSDEHWKWNSGIAVLNIELQFPVVVSFFDCVYCQTVKVGPCPGLEVKENFNVTKYLGKWYEIQRSFAIFEMGLKCVTTEYTLDEDGNLNIFNRGVRIFSNKEENITGIAESSDETEEAKFQAQIGGTPIKSNFWILDTDYNQYSVVMSCKGVSKNIFHFEILWILSRKPTLDGTVLTQIKNYLENRGVYVAGLQNTQQDCYK